MKKTVSLAIATLLASLIGCAATSGPAPMRGASVADPDRAPEVKAYREKVPGVGQPQLFERTFIGQPPLVPHTIDKYVPLTMEENACLECHMTEELRGQKIPQIGESHFSKTLKDKQGRPMLEMSRFQCDTCHVPQVDAQPLVENKFVGVK